MGKIRCYLIVQITRFCSFGILVILLCWINFYDIYHILQYTPWYLLFVLCMIVFMISEIIHNQIYRQFRYFQKILNILGILGLSTILGQFGGMWIKRELMKDIMEVTFCIVIFIIWILIGWQWKYVSKE